uniref:Uncharacterized protein n=1 Tax=Oryza sativa subsp. japonica TaxID=39947 RepID=Q7EYJ8_ORYSJ|nr:hypothetical protein [Oryza sativa Japonica Group]BAD03824.1 hypothetical protein [Oryza sativa Japonica Group]
MRAADPVVGAGGGDSVSGGQIGREAGSGASPSRGAGGGAAHLECATNHRWPVVLASLAPRDLAPAVLHLAPPFLFAPSSPPPTATAGGDDNARGNGGRRRPHGSF